MNCAILHIPNFEKITVTASPKELLHVVGTSVSFAGNLPLAASVPAQLIAGTVLTQSTHGSNENQKLDQNTFFAPTSKAANNLCLALGAHFFSWHLVQLPLSVWQAAQHTGRGQKAAQKLLQQALRNALEDQLLQPTEALHLAAWRVEPQADGETPPSGVASAMAHLVVGVVAHAVLAPGLAAAEAAGLVVRRIVPDVWFAAAGATDDAAPNSQMRLIGTPEQAYMWIPRGLKLSAAERVVELPAALPVQHGNREALAAALHALSPTIGRAWQSHSPSPVVVCTAAGAPVVKSLGAEPQLQALHEQLYDAAQSSWNFAQFELAPRPDTWANRWAALGQRALRTLQQPPYRWLRAGLLGLVLVNGIGFIAARLFKL